MSGAWAVHRQQEVVTSAETAIDRAERRRSGEAQKPLHLPGKLFVEVYPLELCCYGRHRACCWHRKKKKPMGPLQSLVSAGSRVPKGSFCCDDSDV